MNLRHLHTFVTVAEELHFTRAAERLHIAQSALSAQIKSLERDLGAVLFVRNRRAQTTLTPAGQTFLSDARRILTQAESSRMSAQRAARGESGMIRIAYVGSAAFSGILTEVIAHSRSANPGLELQVAEVPTPRQLEALSTGEIDIGFLRWRPSYPAGISTMLLMVEPVVAAIPKHHRLADKPTLDPVDMADEQFITPHFGEEYDFRQIIGSLAGQGGFEPRLAPPVRDFVTALTLVGAGLGVAPVPRSFRRTRMPGVAFRDIAGGSTRTRLVAAFRDGETAPAVQRFISRLVPVPFG